MSNISNKSKGEARVKPASLAKGDNKSKGKARVKPASLAKGDKKYVESYLKIQGEILTVGMFMFRVWELQGFRTAQGSTTFILDQGGKYPWFPVEKKTQIEMGRVFYEFLKSKNPIFNTLRVKFYFNMFNHRIIMVVSDANGNFIEQSSKDCLSCKDVSRKPKRLTLLDFVDKLPDNMKKPTSVLDTVENDGTADAHDIGIQNVQVIETTDVQVIDTTDVQVIETIDVQDVKSSVKASVKVSVKASAKASIIVDDFACVPEYDSRLYLEALVASHSNLLIRNK